MIYNACKYCNTKTAGEFCSESCRAEFVKFQKYVERYTKLFFLGMFGPMVLIVPAFVFIDYALIFTAAMVFIMGATVIVFPFTTPQTVNMFGLKKSIRIGKWCGLFVVMMGAALIVLHVLLYA